MTAEGTQCRLCGRVARLCRSHIVPDFAYAPIKNEKNQIYKVGRSVHRVQTGYFERLLCRECESLISRHERKFKHLWMDTIPPVVPVSTAATGTQHVDVFVDDFDSFKLFHLSVLWRAIVSESFKIERISLGRYALDLATMIRQGDPGQNGDFPFFAVLHLDDEGHPIPTVAPLAKGKGRLDGHHYYMMTYAFCEWVFLIARPGPSWLVDMEVMCRREKSFPCLIARHRDSKSFNLWAQIIRNLRS